MPQMDYATIAAIIANYNASSILYDFTHIEKKPLVPLIINELDIFSQYKDKKFFDTLINKADIYKIQLVSAEVQELIQAVYSQPPELQQAIDALNTNVANIQPLPQDFDINLFNDPTAANPDWEQNFNANAAGEDEGFFDGNDFDF